MKFLAAVLCFTTFCAAASALPDIPLRIAGSVAKPGAYTIPQASATLSDLLERADGIASSGSDLIRITFRAGENLRVVELRGWKFYAQDVDFVLPPDTIVYVAECVAVGLGNLSPTQFERLQELRAEFLKRKREGKIATRALLPWKG